MHTILSGPVGPGRENNPEDVKRVRAALRVLKGEPVDLDDLDDLSGYTDGEVEGGIRDFQEQSGLKVDDWMAPGGETERNMVAALTGEGLDTSRPQDISLRQEVGSGGANGAEDVKTIKRALGSLDYLKYDHTAPPMPYIDAKTVEGIQKFQRDNGLTEDGRATPGGETERALKEKLAEKRKDGVQVANMGPILNLGSKILRLIFKESKSGKPKPNTPSPAPKPDPRKEAVDRMGREIANEAARKSGEEAAPYFRKRLKQLRSGE